MCPVNDQGIECGTTRTSNVPPNTGSSFCSTAFNVESVARFRETPRCMCPPAPDYVMGVDEAASVTGLQMAFQLNPSTGLCEPMCGNGALFGGFDGGSTQRPRCQCAARVSPFKKRAQNIDVLVCFLVHILRTFSKSAVQDACSQYAPPDYKRHLCNNNGEWTGSRCICRGLYSSTSNCAQTDCGPEGTYTPWFGPNICNCTYPYRSELDIYQPRFGRCVSICVHGKADMATRTCICDDGWSGPQCDVNICLPYGRICSRPTPQKPCCCVTPVVTGRQCQLSACGDHGQLVEPLDEPPYCKCDRFFSGVTCTRDECGILGDDGISTGAAICYNHECACKCRPGYDLLHGICARRLCGPRGRVVQDPQRNSFTCSCDGPDTLNTNTNTCDEGQCSHGVARFGVNNTKILCQCDPGYSGASCEKFACPSDHYVYVADRCECRYPFANVAKQCTDNLCGPGNGYHRVRVSDFMM